jgi:hypothetical protein
MQVEFAGYDRSEFNNLQAIEDADALMRKNAQLDLATQVLGPIFSLYNLCDVFGISLLHNHWTLSDGELPIQDCHLEDSRKLLLTCPRTEEFAKEFRPSVFRISSSEPFLHPLEFSTDTCVLDANEVLQRQGRDFAASLSQAAVGNNLEHTFGLCVIRQSTNQGDELVEFNGPERISVVKEVEIGSVASRSLLDTCWRFDKIQPTAACVSSCFARCYVNAQNVHYQHVHTPVHGPR